MKRGYKNSANRMQSCINSTIIQLLIERNRKYTVMQRKYVFLKLCKLTKTNYVNECIIFIFQSFPSDAAISPPAPRQRIMTNIRVIVPGQETTVQMEIPAAAKEETTEGPNKLQEAIHVFPQYELSGSHSAMHQERRGKG